MRAKLRVYGTNTHLLGVQARTIAATTSQREFAKIIGTSLSYVRDYATETWNSEERSVAFNHVGRAFIFCPTCGHWQEHNVQNETKTKETKV